MLSDDHTIIKVSQAQLRYHHNLLSLLERIIASNRTEQWGFSSETLHRFKDTVKALRRAEAMVQRVDWLVSGDDSEETFHELWGRIQ